MNKRKKGRDPDFKCIYCGKYLPYDRRKINIEYRTKSVWDNSEEQYFPEDIIEMSHKKCNTNYKNQNKE